MCTLSCIEFAKANLRQVDIVGKSVIEVGSRDVNGSVRPIAEAFHPSSYLGVDIESGPGVDQICDATEIVSRFGRETFDVLISTELLEHVRDWRQVISNFKNVLKPGGLLLITTRSKGFNYHGYPYDYWRYETSDMKDIFSDFLIDVIEKDAGKPGVFVRARKPDNFVENDTRDYRLYSILRQRRARAISEIDVCLLKVRRTVSRKLLIPIKQTLKRSRSTGLR